MPQQLEPFTTSDTPFAAYLHYHKHRVVGMKRDPNDAKRLVYCFVKMDDTEELSAEFYSGKPLVDPGQYYKSTKEIYRVLRENINR